MRHQGDISALTGYVVEQVIDEFNRPAHADYGAAPVPPSEDEVETLFSQWGQWLPSARKFLPAARDYMAASLWRRAGLRINETRMLDIRDWRRDLGEYGSLHVRFGKSSRGRGPKTRLVPAINSVGVLLDWWMVDVRHQFGDDYDLMDAPLLPAERSLDAVTGLCPRPGDQTLRNGLNSAVSRWLPQWAGKLTPHVLRHFCASSLYARGMDLKAIQELLGHSWLSTTTRYINLRELHRAGENCAGHEVSARSIWHCGHSNNCWLARAVPHEIPLVARSALQMGEISDGLLFKSIEEGRGSSWSNSDPNRGYSDSLNN